MIRLVWGVSEVYAGRVHLVPADEWHALCSTTLLHLPLPITSRTRHRPPELIVCTECCIAYVLRRFPTYDDPNPRTDTTMPSTVEPTPWLQ